MSGNRWDKALGFISFGESHGPAMGILLDDVKPGIRIDSEAIQQALNQRKPGEPGSFSSSRKEADEIEILSGVFNGITTGMPICIIVRNTDYKEKDYQNIKNIFRPGHADFSFFKKYKFYDYRGGGRASGRETISRVIAGSIVEELLQGIKIDIFTSKIGKFSTSKTPDKNQKLNIHNLYWPDTDTLPQVIDYLTQIKKAKESIGGIVKISISNIPAGLGDPVFEKLDANLAKALISIGSVKGIEFGKGFALADMKGSESNDQMKDGKFTSNNCGGILGGISTGQPVEICCIVKPTPSIGKSQKTIDSNNNNQHIQIKGRHDTCIIPRIIPVMKAMIKLVLADALSYQKLINNEVNSLIDYREAIDKIDEDILISIKRRSEISKAIGLYKKNNELPITDKSRESDLLNTIKDKCKIWGLPEEYITEIWAIIIKLSKKYQ